MASQEFRGPSERCVYCDEVACYCEEACEVCGSLVGGEGDSHCKRCNSEYEAREREAGLR